MPILQDQSQFDDVSSGNELADVGRTLRHQWRRIAFITILATLIAVWYVMTALPAFTNNGSLYLGDAQNGPATGAADGINFLSDFASISDVETQIQLIQANTLVEQAILETGLNATVMQAGESPLPYWKWRLRDEGEIRSFAPRPGDLQAQYATISDPAAKGAAFEVLFSDGVHYRLQSIAGWLRKSQPVLSGTLGQPASGNGISLLLKSVLANAPPQPGSRYDLSIMPAKSLANELLEGPLSITNGGTVTAPTKLAKIQLIWSNPYRGQVFVNQLMQDFIATQLSWKTESASTTEDFIAGQLIKIQQSLSQANDSLAKYQSRTGIVDVPANAQAMITQLSQYEVQRVTILLQQKALQQLATLTDHPASGLNPYLVSEANDPVLAQLAGSLATAEINLDAQSTQFTGAAPEMKIQVVTVQKYQNAIRTLIANDADLASTNLANIDALIEQYEDKLKHMPAESLQVIALTRASDVFGQLYVLLMQKEEEAEVSKAATIENTRIVVYAELPLNATRPNASITILAGVVFGLLAGVSRVLAQRSLSGRFQSEDDVRRHVPLAVYGTIPRRSKRETEKSILSLRSQSMFSEGFRLLRSNINQSGLDPGSRIILITSASTGDGKTTIASNLADILADDDTRVVLVDGDLHRGRLHETLRSLKGSGLTEWLATGQRAEMEKVSDRRFLVIPAGILPPNPSELLKASRLGEIFKTLRSNFDYIIVDCPPLPSVADTLLFGKYADLTLSVVRIEHTTRRNLKSHNEVLATLNVRRGMIINETAGNDYGYGYGYGYGETHKSRKGISKLIGNVIKLVSRL